MMSSLAPIKKNIIRPLKARIKTGGKNMIIEILKIYIINQTIYNQIT